MEVVIKIAWTLFAAATIWGLSVFTVKVWRSHIDPTATFSRVISKFQKEPTDLLATREDDALYQNGEVVGRIVGKIIEVGNRILLEEVSDTSKLRRDQDLEFRRMKIRIVSVEGFAGMKSVVVLTSTSQSSAVRTAVMSNVQCRIISKK
jgi:hypothetical protein